MYTLETSMRQVRTQFHFHRQSLISYLPYLSLAPLKVPKLLEFFFNAQWHLQNRGVNIDLYNNTIDFKQMGNKPCNNNQKVFSIPNWISVKEEGKSSKYLTAVQPADGKNDILSVSFQELNKNERKREQLWFVEAKKGGEKFRIRHEQPLSGESYYLTLGNEKYISEENSMRLQKIKAGEDEQYQLWAFDLDKDYHFCLKNVGAEKTEKDCFLSWKFTPLQQDMTPYEPERHRTHDNATESFLQALEEKESAWFAKFKGEYFFRRSPSFKKKAEQYATSSFPEDQMSPFLIACPSDVSDIVLMLRYARDQEKSVVARSGGHQYSGLSSGGEGTIVLSMDHFNEIAMNSEGLIEAEPCVSLKVFSKFLEKHRLTIPHGECPYVNIGGHAQTGGFGNLLHSFGLCLDYVEAFDIVLADGKCLHVARPAATFVPQSEEEQLRIELFRGVLGGNAGSFGIVTKYYFSAIRDEDHPRSYGFCKIRNFDRDLLFQLMKLMQKYSRMIAEDRQSLRGIDLNITVKQLALDSFGLKKPIILLEGIYADIDGNVPYNGQFKQILDIFLKGQSLEQQLLNKFLGYQQQRELSKISASQIRYITPSEREYPHPYKKRCNITMQPITDQFLRQYIDQVAYLSSSKLKSLYLSSKISLGGGAITSKGKTLVNELTQTAIPIRDHVFRFSYDVFYDCKRNPNAEEQAVKLQAKMQKTVDKNFTTERVGEKRLFQVSFGDVDMRKRKVIEMYYESMQQYRKMQELKDKVDRENLFNSFMTVKPTSFPIQ